MALVTRRYFLTGPTNAMLNRFVDPTSGAAELFPTATVDITIDDAVANVVETLDEYMATLGFAFSATNEPIRVFELAGTPPFEATRVLVYGLDVSGTTQLFAITPDGVEYQLTPKLVFADEGAPIAGAPHNTLNVTGAGAAIANAGGGVAALVVFGNVMAPPEQWIQQPVIANQADIPLSAQVSTNFDSIQMPRAGSIVGLSTRFSNTITAGQADVTVTINGVATALVIVHTNAVNQNGGIAAAAVAAIPYVAGALIGIEITTDGAFAAGLLPAVEAWIEVFEQAV